MVLFVAGIVWNDDLDDDTSCHFKDTANNIGHAMDVVFKSAGGSLADLISCFYVNTFSETKAEGGRRKRSIYDPEAGEDLIQVEVDIPIPLNETEITADDVEQQFLFGLNQTDVFSNYTGDKGVVLNGTHVQDEIRIVTFAPPTSPPTEASDRQLIILAATLGTTAFILLIALIIFCFAFCRAIKRQSGKKQRQYLTSLQRDLPYTVDRPLAFDRSQMDWGSGSDIESLSEITVSNGESTMKMDERMRHLAKVMNAAPENYEHMRAKMPKLEYGEPYESMYGADHGFIRPYVATGSEALPKLLIEESTNIGRKTRNDYQEF
ncbi:uncharacterized protein [Ptychodera flava]|uniref:uncharacterized protein isoform X2 n=1 Tax=Ptychodera flava TaxID=63121 RepID=UPI00396A6DD5